jgi:hypothetical protein
VDAEEAVVADSEKGAKKKDLRQIEWVMLLSYDDSEANK